MIDLNLNLERLTECNTAVTCTPAHLRSKDGPGEEYTFLAGKFSGKYWCCFYIALPADIRSQIEHYCCNASLGSLKLIPWKDGKLHVIANDTAHIASIHVGAISKAEGMLLDVMFDAAIERELNPLMRGLPG